MSDSNVSSRFLTNWMRVAGTLGAVIVAVGLLAAPMLLPLLLGEAWWVIVLMALAYFVVISFLVAVSEST